MEPSTVGSMDHHAGKREEAFPAGLLCREDGKRYPNSGGKMLGGNLRKIRLFGGSFVEGGGRTKTLFLWKKKKGCRVLVEDETVE